MNNCKECHKTDANTGWNPRNNSKREKDENGRLVYDAKRYEPGGYFYEKERRKQEQWEKLLDGLPTDFEEFKKAKVSSTEIIMITFFLQEFERQ